MDILFFSLLAISIIALFIGILKPSLAIWVSTKKRNRKSILKFHITIIVVLIVIYSYVVDIEDSNKLQSIAGNNKDYVEVHFIDVGQADSILITTGLNSMLIDAGNNDDSDLVVNYIASRGIKKLDYVIGTHPHEDHIGGLDAVINSFAIDKVLMPKKMSTTKTFEDVLMAIKNKGLKIATPKILDTYELGKAKWTILAPSKEKYKETNNSSIVIKLEYGNNSFIFTGDAEELSEKEMLKLGNLKADVLKVGHHGSKTSTSIGFLNEIDPIYAVISLGADNKYKHPDSDVIERLISKNIQILRTDQLGTIIFTSDGSNISYTFDRK